MVPTQCQETRTVMKQVQKQECYTAYRTETVQEKKCVPVTTYKTVTETVMLKCDLDKRRTILFVDDEDLLLTMGRMVLSAFGYEVLTANSGEKALQLLGNTTATIDLVITDIVMPQMSGRELIDQLQLRLPGVPILRTSGYMRSGGEDTDLTYLQKPFSSQVLIRRVKQLLQNAAAEEGAA